MVAKNTKNAKSGNGSMKTGTGDADEKRRLARLKALNAVKDEINKSDGDGTIMPAAGSIDVETISTGSWSIDSILGGGFPKGRIVEIYGQEASGKTSIALNAVADVQRKGGNAVFIDMEDALDPRYARQLGVDTDRLLVSRPESAEQAVEIIEKFIKSGAVDIIILDSIAAMVPQKDIDAEIGKDTMATRARLMSKFLPRIIHPAMETGTCCVFINQLRINLGVMFGDPHITTGGNAMKYYASQRIRVKRGKSEMDNDTGLPIRTPITVRVDKNKIAPPLLQCTTFLADGKGIDRDNELFDLCLKFGIIRQSGAYFKDAISGDTIAQGKTKVLDAIENNEDGIRDRYIPLMKEHLSAIGTADNNSILKDAISRGDKDVVTSLRDDNLRHSRESERNRLDMEAQEDGTAE